MITDHTDGELTRTLCGVCGSLECASQIMWMVAAAAAVTTISIDQSMTNYVLYSTTHSAVQ